MKRALSIACGLSVIITTISYTYHMQHTMRHLVTAHGQSFGHPFFALHAVVATLAGVLSFVGAYFLLSRPPAQ